MTALPEQGWARDQVTYSHLIRPVVAFIRDHGPVPVERVHGLILSTAAGDLRFASPTGSREEASRLTLNLMVEDIDALTVLDGVASVTVPDLVEVNSAMFGTRAIPTAEALEAGKEDSRRRRVLREWVTRNLFMGKWRNGIRSYGDDDIEWMMSQIGRYGYVGPKMVRDEDTGALLDGALRSAALERLGMSAAEHTETLKFENDMHRLAYILAAHTVTGSKTRVPVTLRDAILKEILPRGSKVLRSGNRQVSEPDADEWLDITGNDFFGDQPEPAAWTFSQPTPSVEPEPARTTTPYKREPTKRPAVKDSILRLMGDGAFYTKRQVVDLLADSGFTSAQVGQAMNRMVNRRSMERIEADGGEMRYRIRTVSIPEDDGVLTPRKMALSILTERAVSEPGAWTPGLQLDVEVRERLAPYTVAWENTAKNLVRDSGPTRTWEIGSKWWWIETMKDSSGSRWLRAVETTRS